MQSHAIVRLTAIILFTASTPAALVAMDATAPHNPPAEAIQPELLQAATVEATRNGIASLLARLKAPDNDSGLVFPPIPSYDRKRVGTERIEVRGEWRMVEVPIYERAYEEALVPKTDEYGNIIGHETKRVLRAGKLIGTTQERRFIRDPKGPDVHTISRALYDKNEAVVVSPGILGLNAMALYVMTQAGLDQDPDVRSLAQDLMRTVDDVGLPDRTWDLAWLAAAYAVMPAGEHDAFLKNLLSKLIDGQITEGDAAGLWGPICINYDLLARFLVIDVKLRPELISLQKRVDAITDRRSANARQLQAQLDKYQTLMEEVIRARKTCSTQGFGLLEVTRQFKPTDSYLLNGLPYYIYNRIAADMDSTFVATFALAEAARSQRLIDSTIRHRPAGHQLSNPIATRKVVLDALKRVAAAQQQHGGWHETNLLVVNHAFDPMSEMSLHEVPYHGRLPVLPSAESVRSNLAGAAALEALRIAAGGRTPPAGYAVAANRAAPRVQAVLNTLASVPPRIEPDRLVYGKESDPLEEVDQDGLAVTQTTTPSDPADLPLGYITAPYDTLHGAAILLDPSSDRRPDNADALRRRIMYRLLVTQGDDGQWHDAGGYNPAITSSLFPIADMPAALRLSRLQRDQPNRNAQAKWLPERWQRYANIARFPAGDDLYPTLASLVFLTRHLDQSISMEGVTILPSDAPPDHSEPPDVTKTPEETHPMTPDVVATSALRINGALQPLLQHIRATGGTSD